MKVQQEIQRFKDGQNFEGDIAAFLAPGADAIDQLATHLRQDPSANVREQIVKVLVQLGTQGDPKRSLRDREVLAVLVRESPMQIDCAYMLAMDKIAELAPAGSIREFAQPLCKMVSKAPVTGLFLVVAKAKIQEALPALRLHKNDRVWGKEEALKIALAALGEKDEEHEFIGKFMNTTDAREKMLLAKTLGRIGSVPALEALAHEMRSPLIFEIPASSMKSVRPEIAKAIHFNYPDRDFLLTIASDADYERIEKFCEQEFKTVWKSQRPPFLVFVPLAPPPR